MNISTFYNSYPGMYLAQSFFHSITTALIVDAALLAWKIENPVVRQRFRLLIIIFPLLSFPLFQAINPLRGSLDFRLNALFDSARWLNLELWHGIPAGLLFLVLLSLTSLVFIAQELVPILQHALSSKEPVARGEKPAADSIVSRALAKVPDPKPEVFIIPDNDLVLFVTTGKHPAIFLSTGTVETLTEEEIQAAIAHEIAHIERNKRPLLIGAFLLRIVQFFNPISLMEFRRIVHEEEKICDDFAVAMTGRSQALADTLRKFHVPPDDHLVDQTGSTVRLKDRLEEYSHASIIENRVARLDAYHPERHNGDRFVFVLTLAAVLYISYSVV